KNQPDIHRNSEVKTRTKNSVKNYMSDKIACCWHRFNLGITTSDIQCRTALRFILKSTGVSHRTTASGLKRQFLNVLIAASSKILCPVLCQTCTELTTPVLSFMFRQNIPIPCRCSRRASIGYSTLGADSITAFSSAPRAKSGGS